MGTPVSNDLYLLAADNQTRVNVGDLVKHIAEQLGGVAQADVPTVAQVNAYVDGKVAEGLASVESSVEAKLAAALAGHGPQGDPPQA